MEEVARAAVEAAGLQGLAEAGARLREGLGVGSGGVDGLGVLEAERGGGVLPVVADGLGALEGEREGILSGLSRSALLCVYQLA